MTFRDLRRLLQAISLLLSFLLPSEFLRAAGPSTQKSAEEIDWSKTDQTVSKIVDQLKNVRPHERDDLKQTINKILLEKYGRDKEETTAILTNPARSEAFISRTAANQASNAARNAVREGEVMEDYSAFVDQQLKEHPDEPDHDAEKLYVKWRQSLSDPHEQAMNAAVLLALKNTGSASPTDRAVAAQLGISRHRAGELMRANQASLAQLRESLTDQQIGAYLSQPYKVVEPKDWNADSPNQDVSQRPLPGFPVAGGRYYNEYLRRHASQVAVPGYNSFSTHDNGVSGLSSYYSHDSYSSSPGTSFGTGGASYSVPDDSHTVYGSHTLDDYAHSPYDSARGIYGSHSYDAPVDGLSGGGRGWGAGGIVTALGAGLLGGVGGRRKKY